MPEYFQFLEGKEIVGALLGAIVGGILTYFATLRQQRIQQKKMDLSMCSLVLLELLENQNIFGRDIDRILPIWLVRGRPMSREAPSVAELTSQSAAPADRIYTHFFPQLAVTAIGPALMNYYARLSNHKKMLASHPNGVPKESLRN